MPQPAFSPATNGSIGENLRRVIARLNLSLAQAARQTGIDRRTLRGILDGSSQPRAQTLHRLAEGLGVSIDELFLEPAQLMYRRFDRQTNPVVDCVVADHPRLFEGWTDADFAELYSRFGAGGALTAEGVVASVEQMNRNRRVHDKLAVLLETSHGEMISDIVEAMYRSVVESRGE